LFECIKIGNFKCIEDMGLKLGKATVLIGPNASGKSSILHALIMFKQLIRGTELGLSGPYMNFGKFKDVVFKHEGVESIHLELGWSRPLTYDLKEILHARECVINYLVEVNPSRLFQDLQISIDSLLIQVKGEGEHRIENKWVEPENIKFKGEDATLGVGSKNFFLFPIIIKSSVNELHKFNDFMSRIVDDIDNIYFVPISRVFQDYAVELDGKPYKDLSAEELYRRASAFLSTLSYEDEVFKKVASWMKKLFEIRVEIKPVPSEPSAPGVRRIALRTLRDERELGKGLSNEAAGILQLLYVLAQVALADKNALIMIEEPEISLHPKAQAALVDIMLEILGEGKQLLFTTHSEHILFRLLTHIAAGRLRKDDLEIYYFEKPDGVTARVSRLEVDGKGRVKGGLRGFFEHDVEELSEYLKVLSHEGASP